MSAESNLNKDSQEGSLSPVGFVLPFVILLLVSSFYPSFEKPAYETGSNQLADPAAATKYLILVGIQFSLAMGLIGYFFRTYLGQFPFRLSAWGVIVGLIGGFLWIWICDFGIEKAFFSWVGLDSLANVRPGFNPFAYIENDSVRWLFLFLRFGLLVIAIPIVEEVFLRGWFVRWFENPQFDQVSLSNITKQGLLAVVVYAVATHPSEAIAAIVWFSMVSFVMIRTGNLWDCVMAHAITNLILGLYIIKYSQWGLW